MTTRFLSAALLCALINPLVHAVPQRALVNTALLNNVGGGNAPLTASFTIEGTAAKTVLIRAVNSGVPSPMADPVLVVTNGFGFKVGENDNWGGTQTLKDAFAAVGASALSADTSN